MKINPPLLQSKTKQQRLFKHATASTLKTKSASLTRACMASEHRNSLRLERRTCSVSVRVYVIVCLCVCVCTFMCLYVVCVFACVCVCVFDDAYVCACVFVRLSSKQNAL
jgi:hypothetical protein